VITVVIINRVTPHSLSCACNSQKFLYQKLPLLKKHSLLINLLFENVAMLNQLIIAFLSPVFQVMVKTTIFCDILPFHQYSNFNSFFF